MPCVTRKGRTHPTSPLWSQEADGVRVDCAYAAWKGTPVPSLPSAAVARVVECSDSHFRVPNGLYVAFNWDTKGTPQGGPLELCSDKRLLNSEPISWVQPEFVLVDESMQEKHEKGCSDKARGQHANYYVVLFVQLKRNDGPSSVFRQENLCCTHCCTQ
jgi:hypothetical protein